MGRISEDRTANLNPVRWGTTFLPPRVTRGLLKCSRRRGENIGLQNNGRNITYAVTRLKMNKTVISNLYFLHYVASACHAWQSF